MCIGGGGDGCRPLAGGSGRRPPGGARGMCRPPRPGGDGGSGCAGHHSQHCSLRSGCSTASRWWAAGQRRAAGGEGRWARPCRHTRRPQSSPAAEVGRPRVLAAARPRRARGAATDRGRRTLPSSPVSLCASRRLPSLRATPRRRAPRCRMVTWRARPASDSQPRAACTPHRPLTLLFLPLTQPDAPPLGHAFAPSPHQDARPSLAARATL